MSVDLLFFGIVFHVNLNNLNNMIQIILLLAGLSFASQFLLIHNLSHLKKWTPHRKLFR